MRQHFLAAYRGALVSVLRAQFSATKRFRGGVEGAMQLARNLHVHAFLCGAGVVQRRDLRFQGTQICPGCMTWPTLSTGKPTMDHHLPINSPQVPHLGTLQALNGCCGGV